jgi:ankyrin repeat protein
MDFRPLNRAIYSNSINDVITILEQIIDINSEGSIHAFHIALEEGNIEIAKLFIDRGIDINYEKWGVNWAIKCAVHSGNTELVRLLFELGATIKPDAIMNINRMIPSTRISTDILILLLEHGADIDSREDGKSSYMDFLTTSSSPRFDVFEYVFAHGRDVNLTNPTGNTFLHELGIMTQILSFDNFKKMLDLAIKYGGNLFLRNAEGQSPQDLILTYGTDDMKAYLDNLIKTKRYLYYKKHIRGDRNEPFLPDGSENENYRNIPTLPPDIMDNILREATGVPKLGGFGLVSLNNDIRYLRRL